MNRGVQIMKLKICPSTKNDQNAKNVSITTVCHMGSRLLSHGRLHKVLQTLLRKFAVIYRRNCCSSAAFEEICCDVDVVSEVLKISLNYCCENSASFSG